jgi:monofunctional biosynthetic peptidoglycan transglycosylase
LKFFAQKIPTFLFKMLLFCLVLVVGVSIGLIGSLRWIDPPTSRFIQYYESSAKRTANKQWISIDKITWHLSLAVIASEDQQFPNHFGFDLDQIQAAMRDNKAGKRLRGASTISQQTIKNLYLWPKQTLFRKGIEAWLSLWLEMLVPKKRILEIYLNIAQFGKSVFGVEASAYYYFGISAHSLNPDQSRALSTCLPAPSRCRPNKPSEHTQKKIIWIKTSMSKLGGKSLIDTL